MGGASGIANGYITSGQDTIFYEKFNLVPNKPITFFISRCFTSQYKCNDGEEYHFPFDIFWVFNISDFMIMLKYPSTVSCMALWSILSMQITYEIQKTDSKRRKVISRSNIFSDIFLPVSAACQK